MGCSTLWLRPSVDRTSARIASTTSSLWLMPLRPFCPTQALLTRDRRAPAPTAPERAKRRYSSKRNNRPDDLLDHHAIVVLLAVGQFIIGNEGRMGLDLVVASRAVLPNHPAASCSISRRCALFRRTVDVSIGLGVYVATLGTPAGCVRLCCLAEE